MQWILHALCLLAVRDLGQRGEQEWDGFTCWLLEWDWVAIKSFTFQFWDSTKITTN